MSGGLAQIQSSLLGNGSVWNCECAICVWVCMANIQAGTWRKERWVGARGKVLYVYAKVWCIRSTQSGPDPGNAVGASSTKPNESG